MALSMTAFARADKQTKLANYTWEIRSVNSRYLELHFRLPDALKSLEEPLREILRKRLSRGKIECSLAFNPQAQNQTLNINEALVAQINAAADSVHNIIGPGNALNGLEILKWPGVLTAPSLDTKEASQDALSSFNHALDALLDMRKREGSALTLFIEQRLDNIDTEMEKVNAILPSILLAQRENLNKKLEKITLKVDNDRLEQEIILVLQKADIDEELDRLKAHLIEVRHILGSSVNSREPVGRRLDFMMQELNREANTLSSKSISHLTTKIAVELKVLIEQMREQIQNLE